MTERYSVDLVFYQKGIFFVLRKFCWITFSQTFLAICIRILNVACMQKIKIGHRTKLRKKNKCFMQLLFPVREILRCISTSDVLRMRLLIEILKVTFPL